MVKIQLEKIASDLLQKNSTSNEVFLKFASCSIHVLANSKELIRNLQEYYSEFISEKCEADIQVKALQMPIIALDIPFQLKKPEPGKTKIKEEYFDVEDGRIIRKRLTGITFFLGENMNLAVGPCVENPNQIINFVNNRYMEFYLQKNYILGHASAISINDKVVAIAGFSGMGKSTLALHLMDENTKFLSNDRVLIQANDNRVHLLGVPKHPRVNPGTILHNSKLRDKVFDEAKQKSLLELSSGELWQLEEKYDILIDEYFAKERFFLEGNLEVLVILNWQRETDEPTKIQKIVVEDSDRLLPAFMKKPGLFYQIMGTFSESFLDENVYKKELREVTIIEISGKTDFAKAKEYIREYCG